MITDLRLWVHQEFALAEIPRLIAQGHRRILLTSPTGGGKSLIICELIRRSLERGWQSVVYTNRVLLIEQLRRVLEAHGIRFGVRASGYHDDRSLPVQISSLPTERQRTIKSESWQIHGVNHGTKVLAIVDEAHLNAAGTAQEILRRHHEAGHVCIGVTASPIDLAHLYDTLVIAGKPSELRRCGALVPAYHYGPDEPDMKGFKPNVKTGEYSENDVRKAIMHKQIFGRVWEWWEKINPEQRPSLLFAPGVQESIWFTEQFYAKGIPWAHIDGQNVWLDGELQPTGQNIREEIIGRLKDGRIKGVSNRFVLREGIDIPEASHGIFATVMGSLQTWLQSGGRLLRACEGKDKATVQDHGGMWHRHGSLNQDRQWQLGLTENILSGVREESFREKKVQEPICCPVCGMVRSKGMECPECGHVASRKSRMVVQRDGSLKEMTGDIYKPRRITKHPNAAKIWERIYYRGLKADMTFRQCEALFAKENNWGWPSRDMPLMPVNKFDWFLKVKDVPKERLQS